MVSSRESKSILFISRLRADDWYKSNIGPHEVSVDIENSPFLHILYSLIDFEIDYL